MTVGSSVADPLPLKGDQTAGRSLNLRLLGVDQAIYSASNFGLAALGGRTLNQSDFGRFAFVILAISVLVNLGKAVWHEPDLATGHRRLSPGPAVMFGVGAAVLVLSAFGAIVASPTLWTMAVLGALSAVAQDRARYGALAGNRIRSVIIGDGAWLALIVAAFAFQSRFDTSEEILLVWICGAVVGLIPPTWATAKASRSGPDSHISSSAGLVAIDQRRALFADFILFSGMTQVGGLALALVLPIEAFASVRGAIIIFGPIGVMTGALTTWIFGSLDRTNPDVHLVSKRAAFLGFGSLALTLLIAFVPEKAGRALLGSGWPPVWVLVGIGFAVAFQAMSTPGMMVLRLKQSHRILLSLRFGALAAFVLIVFGSAAISQSANTTALAYAIVNGLLVLGVWTHLRKVPPA